MKIEEIEKLNKGDVIPSIEGRVIQIYTKPPTDGQKRVNIEPMDVVVEDDDGKQIKVNILRKSMHIPAGSQGRRILFECGEGERGPDGLKADPYQGTMRVSCSGTASIRFRDEEAPAPKPLPEKKGDNAMLLTPGPIPAPVRRTTNVTDHCLTIVEIYNSIMSKLQRDDCDMAETVAKLATTVYIETSRQALIVPRPEGDPVPVEVEQMAEQAATTEEAPPAATEKSGFGEIRDWTLSEVVSEQLRTGKGDIVKMEKFLKNRNKRWEDVYDEMVETIVLSGVDKKYVDQAYDEFNGARLAKGQSEENFIKTLFTGMKDLAETARDIQDAAKEPKPETLDDDTFV